MYTQSDLDLDIMIIFAISLVLINKCILACYHYFITAWNLLSFHLFHEIIKLRFLFYIDHFTSMFNSFSTASRWYADEKHTQLPVLHLHWTYSQGQHG